MAFHPVLVIQQPLIPSGEAAVADQRTVGGYPGWRRGYHGAAEVDIRKPQVAQDLTTALFSWLAAALETSPVLLFTDRRAGQIARAVDHPWC